MGEFDMKAIVLHGKTNSGKSSSLKYCFIEMLKDKDFRLLWKSKRQYADNKAIIKDIEDNWQNDAGTYVRDISGVFEYKGKKIFIVTIGDSIEDIKKQLKNRIEAEGKIDLFLCSRHDCNDLMQELANENVRLTKVYRVDKHRAKQPDKYESENKETARELFEKIKNLFNN